MIKAFKEKLWLASPFMHGNEQEYVKAAFDANWITTAGENINELERSVCEYTGCKYAVALSSGTSALHLAMIDAGVKRGDKVFCSDMTFAATVNPVKYQGAEPIFIDGEYESWNMDPNALEKAFNKYPDVKVVVVVNLYGTPAKLDLIKEICERHNAVLVEDAAESFGARYHEKQTGTWGDYGIISFNGNKIITGSTGGMILTDDQKKADHIRKISTQAREPFPWYQHEEIGYNYRMSNIVAGVARGQLVHLDEHIAGKKTIYDRYKNGLKDLPVSMNPVDINCAPNYWLSCMLIDKTCPITSERIRTELEKYNVESRPIWKPMHMQPVYKESDLVLACPETRKSVDEDVFNRGICLPSDLNMTEEQQNVVINIISNCFK